MSVDFDRATITDGDNANVFFEAHNMTDEPLRFFSGRNSGRLAENEIYGWNVVGGVQVKF